MVYTGEIDLLVGVYSFVDIDVQVERFIESMKDTCDLSGVNVFFIERASRPVSDKIKDLVLTSKFSLITCPILPCSEASKADTAREDTSLFCNWMIDNVGDSPWVWLSHFDLIFIGDFVTYARELIENSEMIGNHHDGTMLVSRDAYYKCQVGFSGVDEMSYVVTDYGFIKVIQQSSPRAIDKQRVLSFDVGELLALRMGTLGFRHTFLRKKSDANDIGKTDLFVHVRQGSGHADGMIVEGIEVAKLVSQAQAILNPIKTEYREQITKMNGCLVEPEMLSDGTGRWLIHLDHDGAALCGSPTAKMRTNEPLAANCLVCLAKNKI